VAQEIEIRPNSSPGSREVTSGAAGEPGVKVMALPDPSMATHWVVVVPATSLIEAATVSMLTGCGATGCSDRT
jgi:hypothetical protein